MEFFKNHKKWILGAIILFVLAVYYIYTNSSQKEVNMQELEEFVEENTILNTQEEQTEKEVQKIIIHVAGQVANPGVVQLEEGARITDAISAAGGILEKADLQDINLARILEDGMKIYIPSIEERNENFEKVDQNSEMTDKSGQTTKRNGKVNINTASKKELTTLEGIGETTADRIIEYRKEIGKFKTIEDLKNVKGIGDAKFNKIKEKVEV